MLSNSMQAGDFLMGDFTMGAALYNREGITVRTSESHADLFVRNGVAILAELRAGLGVELPKAFVKGTFEATTQPRRAGLTARPADYRKIRQDVLNREENAYSSSVEMARDTRIYI